MIYPFQRRALKRPVDLALLADVLDSIEDAFSVVDRLGRILHENAAFGELVAAEGQVETMRDEIRCLARTALVSSQEISAYGSGRAPAASEFRVGHANYRARASLMRAGESDPSTLVLVALERTAARPLPEHLRVRHRLTPRETQVLELLAEGHSNRRVAEALGVSTHTARHHTGRVLSKFRASGRAEIAALVRGLHR